MPRLKFTATWTVGAMAPGEYLDTALPNFGLRVQPDGRRAYFVRVREAGQRVRITLGPAPHPGMTAAARALTLTLAAARAAAGDKLKLHHAGARLRPPVITTAAGADAADLRPDTLTVAQLAAAFLAKQGGKVWSDEWRRQVKYYLTRLIVPAFGHRLATSIQRREIREWLEAYAQRGPTSANMAHAIVTRMFRWALERDYLLTIPTMALIKPTPTAAPRSRVLSHDEIRKLWTRLDELERTGRRKRDRVQVAIWRLRLLTAQREITLRRMEWSWINFEDGVITFPAPAMKRKTQPVPHLIPLTPAVRLILEQRRAEAHVVDRFVFGSQRGGNRMPAPARGLKLGLPDFQGKDLRRTATTLMRTHGGVDRESVKWVLNHKVTDVTGVYDRYDMFDEKRAALDKLDRIVKAILHPSGHRDTSLLRFPSRAS